MRNATLVVLLLAACTAHKTEGGIEIQPITNRIGDWKGTLAPQSSSRVRGSVAAQSAAVTTSATISIAGATPGAQHPWHIHHGACGDNGAIVGDAGAYPVLNVTMDGTASASVNLKAGLDEHTTYSVNVHRSAGDMGTILACAPLTH